MVDTQELFLNKDYNDNTVNRLMLISDDTPK